MRPTVVVFALAFVLALALVAVTGADAKRAHAVDPTPATPAKAEREALEALLAETDAIAKTVSEIRGLPVKKTITRGLMSKDQIEARVLLRLDEEYDAAELTGEARALERLGLLPAGVDYKQLVMGLFEEQIAGFYDPAAKELYLADWLDAEAQRLVMAHEIDHALQDQAFDLVKFVKPVKGNADAQLARQALVEGDGLALMVEFMYREQQLVGDPWADDRIADQAAGDTAAGTFPAFDAAPLYLQEALMFPYVGGLRLVGAARRHNAWKRVDDMYKKPPASTEQVLHPEKYFAKDKPIVVKTAALPSLKKWKPVYKNVLGELVWSVFLRQHGVKTARARDAAEGWGGDAVAVFAPPTGTATDDGTGASTAALLVVSVSMWDAEADAIEAWDATSEALETLLGREGVADDGKGTTALVYTDDAAHTVSWIERKGARVSFVLGAPADLAKKLRAELATKWK